jgi:hypothetical protein
MKLKLTSNDRKAIDLLLDQTIVAASAPTHGVAAAGMDHVQAVRRVFDLLQVLPLSEPSFDLAARTLAHISRATGSAMPAKVAETRSARDSQSQHSA